MLIGVDEIFHVVRFAGGVEGLLGHHFFEGSCFIFYFLGVMDIDCFNSEEVVEEGHFQL